ncbi:MAG: hypothetical protein K0M45_05155 [Candidatus Paracaedibacteraceae bacterium]|nr:hypothetical protein [Candidatus Paracaedibacteraceae bacterium]
MEKDITLERKVGNLIIVGFQGTSPEMEDPQQIIKLLQNDTLSGVILYAHNIVNPEQLYLLTKSFYNANPKAFICIDQEGGAVQRLTQKKGFSVGVPRAEEIVCTYSPSEAQILYSSMAEELKRYYINVNFGPIVDLNNSESPSPVIGKLGRSYGNIPEKVVKYGTAFIDAHRQHHVLTAAKHWPGHGYSTEDSHKGLTDTTKTAIPEKELTPYAKLNELGYLDMVMTAHVVNENYDSLGYPATLSPRMIPSLLRRKGYNGVVVSDDMHMGAIQQHYSLQESVQLAFNATCDLLIFSNNLAAAPNVPNFKPNPHISTDVFNIVKDDVEQGRILLDRINEAYGRVIALKDKL